MSAYRVLVLLVAMGCLAASVSEAQRVIANPKEPAPPGRSGAAAGAAAGTSGSVGTSLPAPSLTPSFPVITAPKLEPYQPAPVFAAPPARACEPASSADCAASAGQCLANEFLSGSYDVRWDEVGPYIYRFYDTGSDEDYAAASQCAADLQQCLASPCGG